MQKATTKAISSWYDRTESWGIRSIPVVAFEVFVEFANVVKNLLLSIGGRLVYETKYKIDSNSNIDPSQQKKHGPFTQVISHLFWNFFSL